MQGQIKTTNQFQDDSQTEEEFNRKREQYGELIEVLLQNWDDVFSREDETGYITFMFSPSDIHTNITLMGKVQKLSDDISAGNRDELSALTIHTNLQELREILINKLFLQRWTHTEDNIITPSLRSFIEAILTDIPEESYLQRLLQNNGKIMNGSSGLRSNAKHFVVDYVIQKLLHQEKEGVIDYLNSTLRVDNSMKSAVFDLKKMENYNVDIWELIKEALIAFDDNGIPISTVARSLKDSRFDIEKLTDAIEEEKDSSKKRSKYPTSILNHKIEPKLFLAIKNILNVISQLPRQ